MRVERTTGGRLLDAQSVLDKAREQSDTALVFYSGGKDSMTVTDLASRVFPKLVLCFMHFIPGLDVSAQILREGTTRYNCEGFELLHWATPPLIRDGVFCNNHHSLDCVPDMNLRTVYDMAKAQSGIRVVLHGGKRCDSSWRRRHMATTKHWTDVFYPLRDWSKRDVLAYLATRGLKPFQSASKNAGGIGLNAEALSWIERDYPQDLKRIEEIFPYCRAAIKRAEWYADGA